MQLRETRWEIQTTMKNADQVDDELRPMKA